jgi:hypothetical protein
LQDASKFPASEKTRPNLTPCVGRYVDVGGAAVDSKFECQLLVDGNRRQERSPFLVTETLVGPFAAAP